jgi:hypothetical protein
MMRPLAPVESDDDRVVYCLMLDSVPSAESCSSPSSSNSSGSKSIKALPPPILDLFISVELSDIPEMLEDWAAQRAVPVEVEAHAISPVGEFLRFCILRMFCGAVVGR